MSSKFKIFPAGFPDFEIGNIESLPIKAKVDIQAIDEFLKTVLIDNEYLELVYPINGEIEITLNKNLDNSKYKKIGEIIYDFVIYGKPLPE